MAKIALITKSLNYGGIERVICDLSIILSEQGHDVFLFLMDTDSIVYDYTGRIVKIGEHWWQHLFNIYRAKRKYKIDCAISSFEYVNVVNLLTGYSKIVPMLHNFKFQDEISGKVKDRFLEWLFTRFSRRSDAIVCVSGGVANKAFIRYPKANIKTIYNSVDIDSVVRLCAAVQTPLQMNGTTFVHVGRLCEQKAQVRLISAFALLHKNFPEAQLLIIGDGSDRERLEKLADGLGVAEHVTFLGFQKNPFVYIAAAKAFVLSSDYEGFGNVIVEALACGVPVISTDCESGPREILAPGTEGPLKSGIECTEYGVLSALNTESLSSAMSEVLTNKRYRNCPEKFRQRAKDFSRNHADNEWYKLIGELLNETV